MDITHLIPLYKILCVTIILLVPLLPAWLLYRIAPADKILAKGNFKGFKINATGAIAIFVVLFAAIYANISDVNKSIDRIENDNKRIDALTQQVQLLEKRIPWKLECKIQIMKKDTLNIDDNAEYDSCLKPACIQTLPMPLTINTNTRVVSFYVDDEVLRMRENSCSITLPGKYGSKNLRLSDGVKDTANKSIFLVAKFFKNSNDANLRGNKEDALNQYNSAQGLDKLTPLSSN